jgi:hypothetical protein
MDDNDYDAVLSIAIFLVNSVVSCLDGLCEGDETAQTSESSLLRRAVVAERFALFVSPSTVCIDQAVFDGVLVREQSIHHLSYHLLRNYQLDSQPGWVGEKLALLSIITLTSCEWNQLCESKSSAVSCSEIFDPLALVPVTNDHHLVIVRSKLDVAVSLLFDRI